MDNHYKFEESKEVITPALVYYLDIIKENIKKAVDLAGGPGYLWPHVKTHKMAQMVRLQMEAGITRFKCATIAEAEMAAGCGAGHVLVAYPLVGPNISRFIQLMQAYPKVCFWAVGDNEDQIRALGQLCSEAGLRANVLVDVNLGMDRTGVPVKDTEAFFMDCALMDGVSMMGLHCYDGHRTEHDFTQRKKEADTSAAQIKDICRNLCEKGYSCKTLVLGGSPPCHAMWIFPGQGMRCIFPPAPISSTTMDIQ